MTHEDKKIGGTKGNFASEEEKVAGLLSGLKRVEAPKDLEFHVRSRIARGDAKGSAAKKWFPAFGYAVPLVLFLIIGGGILWNSSLFNESSPTAVQVPTNSESDVAAKQDEPQPAPVPTADVNTPPEEVVASVPANQPVPAPERARADVPSPRPGERVRETAPAPSGGSTDTGLRAAPTPINPPTPKVTHDPGEMAPKPVGIKEALESIGIAVESVEGALVVRSVTARGFGSELGVKAGDKLEAIDGRSVNDKSEFAQGAFKVKTIRVRRGTTILNLALRKPAR